jgi:hypothetical protein
MGSLGPMLAEAVYFNLNGTWVEWDTRVGEDVVQRAEGQYVASILLPKRGRAGAEALPPHFLSLHPGCSDYTRVRVHWARYWGR